MKILVLSILIVLSNSVFSMENQSKSVDPGLSEVEYKDLILKFSVDGIPFAIFIITKDTDVNISNKEGWIAFIVCHQIWRC